MTDTSALPWSDTQAAATARIADLRRDAEHARLVRAARVAPGARPGRRRTQAWPITVVTALRESLAGPSTRRTASRDARADCLSCA